MDYFSIRTVTTNDIAEQEKQMATKLYYIAENVSSILGQLSGNSALKSNLRSDLNSAGESISAQQGNMARLSAALFEVTAEYEAVEKGNKSCQIIEHVDQITGEVMHYVSSIAQGIITGGVFRNSCNDEYKYAINDTSGSTVKNDNIDFEFESDWKLEKRTSMEQEIYEWDDKKKKRDYEIKDGKFVKKEEKEAEEKKVINAGTIAKNTTIYSHKYSDTDSLISGDKPLLYGKKSGDYGNISGTVEALTLDRYVGYNISAGGISGAAGYQVTVFNASGSAQLGNDMLGIHGGADVEVLTAGISGKGEFSYINDEGEFELNANVGVEAGAYLFSASATAGVDVLGADVDVAGSFDVGVGAHAEFGFEDGKFKVDVGASLGIGVSVNLEIDVSEPVGEIIDWAGDAYSATADFIGDIGEGIGDVWDSACDWFSDFSLW